MLISKDKESVLHSTHDSDCFEADWIIKVEQGNPLTHTQNPKTIKAKDIGQTISESRRNLAILEAHFSQSLNNNVKLIHGILSPLDQGIFIKQFIDEEQTPLLLRFLQEIITRGKEFRIDESEHKNVLYELFSVYDKCISSVQKSLSQEEKEEYQVIVAQTKQMIDLISKSEDKRYSKMDKKMITLTNMLRLDALQYVLLANYEYQNLYGQFGINCSIYSRIIRYKFYLTQSQYKSYPRLFQTMLNFLQFRYEEYYQQAISLLCLLKIALSRTQAWQRQQKLLLSHPQITCNQAIEPPFLKMNYWKKIPSKIALRFCQFCKFPQGISIPNNQILDIRKQQTMIQLQKIPKDASLFKIGRILINLRVQLQIPLQQVCRLYSSMKDNPLLRYTEIQEIKKKMEPCKWLYVSAINTQRSLQRLTQTKVDEKLLVKRHNPISIALTEITFERFQVYRRALNLQLQISQRFKHSTPIYIYCCECCYHSFCQNDYQRRVKGQSPASMIIIAFQKNSLLFSLTIRKDIIQEQLIDVFTMYFEQNPIEQGTDLVVYYKKYESKMDNEVIDRYANNFKKKYNSFVYFSMEPQHFKPQIAIHHLIIYYLRKERHLNLLNFEERLYAITRLITTKIYCYQR